MKEINSTEDADNESDYINAYPESILYIPRKYRTLHLWKIVIQKEPEFIHFASEKFQVLELWKIAVVKDPDLLMRLPKKFQVDELFCLFLENHPKRIRNFSKHYFTHKVCETALANLATSNLFFINILRRYYDLATYETSPYTYMVFDCNTFEIYSSGFDY